MPLPRAPQGPVSNAKSTFVGDFRYGVERILLKRGTTFTWRFMGAFQHDVTVIGGPEGFSAPWTQTGIFTHRFTKTGTYRLFCSLHPSKMVQQITVR
jgi:plastocyanin